MVIMPMIHCCPYPVLIARALFTRIMSLQGDEGAKCLLKAQNTKVVELPVDDAGVLADIDTVEDLLELSGPSFFGLS
jgi:molybdenum cofactor cytidylyltransferase